MVLPATGRIAAAAVSAVLLLPLAACASDTGQTTITVNINKPPALFEDLIAQFEEENPDVRVQLDPHEAGFIPDLVRGDPPDVRIAGWASAESVLAQRGVFTDLSDTEAAQRIPDTTLDLVRQWGGGGGKLDALPFSLVSAGVIYNKEIFAEQGLEVPQTWDEFQQLCETLTERDITPIYGTFREPWTTDMVMDYVVGDFSDDFAKLREDGPTLTPTSPSSFEGLIGGSLDKADWIFEQTQPDARSKNYADGNVAFANGAAAMYFQGPWALSEVEAVNPDIELGTFALPTTNDPADTQARIVLDLVVSIPTGAKHEDEARRLIEFMYEDRVNADYNTTNAAFSPLESVGPPTDPRLAGLVPYVEDQRFYLGMSAYFGAIPKSNYFQEFALYRNQPAFTTSLTEEWQREARRNELRGIQ
ncbi:ABC transporter substrate-binding protein [Mycetocola reblochoni]|uniref:Multiple sugar ABC transporter, substrate-binding protein n=2 Tax=Mycetocola reblochoni TaxID=331618 RepID=A0A1R4IZG1_9MICO|nr:extracellular solute-binding protein [Mycetocola reblochoni]RLP68218.1 extracellular solute-binding protein [Mycetocola reblochoni]SJN25064.1 Multiple sugar ABC transporter, substrate-binding protein [Mycetocola reblochoni REB411]